MLRQDDLYVLYPPYCDVGKECYMIYINEFVKPITCGGTTRNELFSICSYYHLENAFLS